MMWSKPYVRRTAVGVMPDALKMVYRRHIRSRSDWAILSSMFTTDFCKSDCCGFRLFERQAIQNYP